MSESIRISLKAARVNAGLTMEDVCKSLRVSKATVLNWEKGYTMPSAEKAIAMSELYKIPLENIIFYKNS